MGTAEIAKALVAFQAEVPKVAKANRATVPTKAGGSYSYRYADLADVAEAALPVLGAHGLAFVACPETTDGRSVLTGHLLHISGESLTGTLPLNGGTPQELGSSITYMRRYLLCAMTGLITDEDDDGGAAQRAASRPAERGPAPDDPWATDPPPPDAAPRPSGGGSRPASENQQKAVHAVMGKAGFKERVDILTELTSMFGREIRSARDLTSAEASLAIRTYEIPEAPRE